MYQKGQDCGWTNRSWSSKNLYYQRCYTHCQLRFEFFIVVTVKITFLCYGVMYSGKFYRRFRRTFRLRFPYFFKKSALVPNRWYFLPDQTSSCLGRHKSSLFFPLSLVYCHYFEMLVNILKFPSIVSVCHELIFRRT